jgi:predicted membrane protein
MVLLFSAVCFVFSSSMFRTRLVLGVHLIILLYRTSCSIADLCLLLLNSIFFSSGTLFINIFSSLEGVSEAHKPISFGGCGRRG